MFEHNFQTVNENCFVFYRLTLEMVEFDGYYWNFKEFDELKKSKILVMVLFMGYLYHFNFEGSVI